MPEDAAGSDLETMLEHLEDFALDTENYEIIQNALEKSHGNIKVPVVEKLLTICVHDLKQEMKNAVNTLNIVAAVLKKIHAGELHETPDLVPSAIAVLHIIKTTAIHKLEELKKLCFEILLLYPNDVLISLAVSHSKDIMEIINLYYHQRVPLEMRLQLINIIFKILKILPPDKLSFFVREGVDLWFTKMIPTVMMFMSSDIKNTMPLDTLEILTEELITIDYANNQNWQLVLQCIYTPQKYPTIMKNLLEAGSDLWYRLWIIFIKLLKNQITKSISSVGSPINSMLPVVETAFKMNVKNRCRAFQCWNVLIDNFSTETNDTYVNKRLKLLIIPLASNNAKVEETALSKLNTWWHLIRQFETKIKNYSEMVLLPFLHFCFGKPAVPEKPVFAPGLLTVNTKRQVLQAFANIGGHINCDCSVTMAKLHSKILSYVLLIDHWKHWTNALTMTIRICVNDNSDTVFQHFKCIWKSVIATIVDISDINVRNNLFIEILTILKVLLQSSQCDKLADLVFTILTNTILDHNKKVQPLFKAGDNNTVNKVIYLILNPSLDYVYTRYDAKEIIHKIIPLTNFFAEEYLNLVTGNYLKKSFVKNSSLILWTALSISLCELKCDHQEETLRTLLLLPLKSMNLFTSVESSTTAWISLYKHVKTTLKGFFALDEAIYDALSEHKISSTTNKYFMFLASLALLNNNKITSENEDLICKITEILDYATYETDYFFSKNDIIFFVETLTLMLNNITNINNEKLARTTVLIIKNFLKITFQCNENKNDGQVLNFIVQLVVPLNLLFSKQVYSTLKSLIVEELIKLMPFLKLSEKYKNNLEIINNMVGQKTNEGESAVIYSKESNEVKKNEKIDDSGCRNKFIEPIIKEQSDKSKKKSSEVVDTVVENGEEYVVVNSNWKFNPKTLTDNQKEKLQRTREDIPALYQDLSQSQDEFKKVFTMNSIDSSTSSKSFIVEKEDASSILKNMLSSNAVLTVTDNIRTEDTTEEILDKPSHSSIKTSSVVEKKLLDSKSPKSPRVALKDRVFRNVKNLIEKSGLQGDAAVLNSTVNDNIPSTPPTKHQTNNNVINSAPSEINSERPSRVKRKPKKFEDLKPFLSKRRRNSITTKLNINTSHPHETELVKSEANSLNANVAKADKIHDTANDNNLRDNDVNTNINENECEKQDEVLVTPEISQTCFQNNVIEEKICIGDLKETNSNVDIKSSEEHSQAIRTSMELETRNDSDDVNLPNSNLNMEVSTPKSSNKKTGKRISRIEKELAIDMVEGHPFLKLQSEKRLTRKTVLDVSPLKVRRKSFVEKLNKSKVVGNESQSESKFKVKSKSNRTGNEKENDSLESLTSSQSQDIIESSQESSISTLSTLSAKTSKKISKKVTTLTLEKPKEESKDLQQVFSHDTLNNFEFKNKNMSEQNIDDTELSRNKTVIQDSAGLDYTEEMDTELPGNNTSLENGTEIRGDDPAIVITDAESDTANADTQILDSEVLLKESTTCNTQPVTNQYTVFSESNCDAGGETPFVATLSLDTKLVINNSDISKIKDDETDCSPLKDEAQRKKDFMNNTLEISPIKTLSPVQEEKISSTPETSSDFVVITLSSPVQSNGEPFDKSDSPEIFTNGKTSPDKRDQSPPRGEIITNNSSPSLSLKKNRPQVRSGGRAAQMLVLCVPDTLPTIVNQEKSAEPEDVQRSIATNTSARRNLRILYNTANENNNKCDKNEDSENFLKLKRSLPTADSSPSGPILKRKLTDIIDESTFSPVSKRKRVSFHDPPVSTTICVKKYIEPSGIRSPQNSAIKRLERQSRASVNVKSTKRLDNIFKLDRVLTKAVESFMDYDTCINDDNIEMSSLEQTTIAEVINTSVLNDVDPICAALVNCEDPISNIASELLSPVQNLQLMKEFEGTVQTIGDLAKMSELEINRLSIKSPKLQVARKALADYASQIETLNGVEAHEKELMINSECEGQSTELLSDRCVTPENKQKVMSNMGVQTQALSLTLASTQTDSLPICNTATQTTKLEEESTSSVILSCLSERPDFVGSLCKHLDESSKQEIASDLSLTAVTNTLMKKLDTPNKFNTMSALLDQYFKSISSEEESSARLSVIRNYLCDRFKAKDLILFCSDILREAYEKPF